MTGSHADDRTAFQLTTLHAPSNLNHTTDEEDFVSEEVANNLKGNRNDQALGR